MNYKVLKKSDFKKIERIKFSVNKEDYFYFYSPEFRSPKFLEKHNFVFDDNKLFGSNYDKRLDSVVSSVSYSNKYNQNSVKVYNYLKHKYRIKKDDFYKEHFMILYKNLFQTNLALITKTINKYINITKELKEQVYDEAILTLQKSINLFCPFYGIQFSTYVVNSIKHNLFRKIINKKNKLNIFNISDSFETFQYKFDNELVAVQDTNIEDREYELKIKDMIFNAMKQLDKRKQKIISLRFGLNGNEEHNLDETGKVFDISKERVRQIQSDSIEQMLSYFNRNNITLES